MKINFLLVLLSFSFFFSCKKEKDEEAKPVQQTTGGGSGSSTYSYLDTSVTLYKYKPGTYWVYENDSTLALDSVVVNAVDSAFYNFGPPHSYNYSEYYQMYFQHFGTSQVYNQTLLGYYLFRDFAMGGSSFTAQPVHAPDRPIGFSIMGMTIVTRLPSLNVSINTFNDVDDVKIVAVDQSIPVFLYDTHLYYCDSVGLIKKETELSPGNIESWSLKRWNIIR